MQLALRSLQLNREPSLRAVAGNFLKGAALPIVLPTAAAATAFEALRRQFEGARSEGLSIQYAPRRRLRGKQRPIERRASGHRGRAAPPAAPGQAAEARGLCGVMSKMGGAIG
jgi:hypothetical protein